MCATYLIVCKLLESAARANTHPQLCVCHCAKNALSPILFATANKPVNEFIKCAPAFFNRSLARLPRSTFFLFHRCAQKQIAPKRIVANSPHQIKYPQDSHRFLLIFYTAIAFFKINSNFLLPKTMKCIIC